MENTSGHDGLKEGEVVRGGIAILYRQGAGGLEFLVVENAKTGNVTFVGGAQESSDASEQSGLEREIEEELGIPRGVVVLRPTNVRHDFVFGPNKIERVGRSGSYQVFLGDVTSVADGIFHTKELRSARWFSRDATLQALTFADLKDVFIRAAESVLLEKGGARIVTT